jgi:hypothetical protein
LEADCQTPEFRGKAHGSPVETSSASDAVDGSPDTRSACLAEGIGREHWNQQLRLDWIEKSAFQVHGIAAGRVRIAFVRRIPIQIAAILAASLA